MSLTPSNMMPLGHNAPDFKLMDVVAGNFLTLNDVRDAKGLMVLFICVHCPYVIHVQERLISIAKEYKKKGIGVVAISSNDVEKYPQDNPEQMKRQAEEFNFNFPYLYDKEQEVAKAYMAACTPDLYVFDENLNCYYRGRMDESTPGNGKVNDGNDLINALESLLSNKPSPPNQFPSVGCNIKWKG